MLIATLASAQIVLATPVPDCEALAARIGVQEGLPTGLLPAISRIESGRKIGKSVRAWPWTLNHAGKGLYFESRQEAMAYLRKTVKEGPRNIDVGCMQINNYWHGKNFPSLDAMMEPETNIRYAVRYLKDLYREKGSWEAAVRNYHSPDAARGARYHRAFLAARASIAKTPGATEVGPMVTAASVSVMGTVSMAEAGLFGAPLVSGGAKPLIASLPVTEKADATQTTYEALLEILSKDGAGTLPFQAFDVELASSSRSQVLNRNWDQIEAFRQEFKATP